MTDSQETLVCPQCALEVEEEGRCPECGTPCVPESALRLTPGPEADASSYGEVVELRDPFEGQHLVALLESRRIPAMIRGGNESALAGGWVDHSAKRHGVLLVPEGRLAEARDLVGQFRAEADRSESLDDEELAEIAEAAGPSEAVEEGRRALAPSGELRLGGLRFSPSLQLALGLLGVAGALFALRMRRLLVTVVLAGWGLYALSSVETEVVLDAEKRAVRVWRPWHRLLGRAPDWTPWGELTRVTVTEHRGRFRVTLEGSGKPIHGPGHRHLAAATKSAKEASAFLAIPYRPMALAGREG
ncbi:MAG: hypothetical protein P1V51_24905 [Deltaproteobacteria bacterium]|nr:hypothetical protein [Deltaproteobacteria bacterium]